jgi:hypothetical protein
MIVIMFFKLIIIQRSNSLVNYQESNKFRFTKFFLVKLVTYSSQKEVKIILLITKMQL